MAVDAARALLCWYAVEKRRLPWRAQAGETPDPYRVWLSEVMLQQTTVAAVKPYFEAFTARWPTVEALAAAEDAEVMRAWAGLGYYARARNLLACARVVANEHEGRFPADEAALRKLPGIGAYTAAAIAAIAFGKRAVVVDGNVERVISRLHAIEDAAARVAAPDPRSDRRDDPANRRGRFRPGDDGPRRDGLHAAQSGLRALPADRALPGLRRRQAGALSAQGRRKPPGRAARASLTGSNATARCCSCGVPPKACSAAWSRLPTDEPPAAADWRDAGAVDHVFTHFALTMRLRCAEADGRGGRPLVAGRPARRSGPADPLRQARGARRGLAGGGMSAPGFTGAGIDRADHLRLDPARIAALRAQEGAKLLMLAELDPVLDEEDRLLWSESARRAETIFLGLEDGVPLVRAAGPSHAGPAGVERVRPA